MRKRETTIKQNDRNRNDNTGENNNGRANDKKNKNQLLKIIKRQQNTGQDACKAGGRLNWPS